MATALPTAEPTVVERSFSPAAEAELQAIVKKYPEKRAALLPALRICEREFGCVDHGGMKLVAEKLDLTPAYVLGTVSFYTHFRRPSDGTFVIEVCRTLPCALRGADDFAKHVSRKLGIQPGETTKDGRFTLKNAECMAACDKAPVAQVNGYNWELLDPKTFDELLDQLMKDPGSFNLRKGCKDPYPWTQPAEPTAQRTKPEGERDYEHEALTHEPQLLRRCYKGRPATYAEYVADGGYKGSKAAVAIPPAKVTEMVKDSGLRGRGGAGFLTGMKWGFIPSTEQVPGNRYLVINADESEPGTFKDRKLMEDDPHLLLEGIVIASHAIGANDAYIYIRGEMVYGAEVLEQAIAEAYKNGVFGPDALGFGKRLDCVVHRGAGAYICGEETALLSSLEGGRGYPRLKPPFPAIKGAWGQPTIVNNVETIANLPYMFGAFGKSLDWYKGLGTPGLAPGVDPKWPRGRLGSRGPKVWCVSGHVNRPGLYDVPFGLSLKQLIMDPRYCGGIRDGRKLKGIVPGGSSFQVLKADEVDVALCYDAIADAGSSVGSAAIFVFDDSTCMVNALWNVLRFYAHESCGQCTPCREGSGWMERIVARIEQGMGTMEDLATIDAIADQACGKTICVFAEAFSWPAQSYIKQFKDEFVAHIKQRRCPQGGRLCAPSTTARPKA
ncbi:MAG: NADH-quinone oxidoreductase subunit NuoF [Planctomycetes bacterium]|nr:NADH-quinone oxidoreductase subunit NuoF [Planctomycetota bacterium]